MPKLPGKASAADPLAQRGGWLGDGLSGRVVTWLRSIWRRRWLSLATAWATCMIGWAAIALWPTSYSSSAVIYAETDELSRQMEMASKGRTPIAILRDVLLSDDNLAAVRNRIDLDEQRGRTLPTDIMLRPTVPPVFVAAYHHEDASVARAVLQALLTNAAAGLVAAADEDTAALDAEIEEHQRRSEAAEKDVAAFKRANSDHLEGADVRGAKFALLEEEVQSLQKQVDAAIAKRDQVATVLAEAPAAEEPAAEVAAPTDAGPVKSIEDIERERATLEAELAKLRRRYADSHPYVVAVLDTVKTLEAEATSVVKEEEAADAAVSGADDAPPVDLEALQDQHERHTAQVSSLNNDLAKKRREIDLLRTLTDTTTSVEAELAELEAAKTDLGNALAELKARRTELGGQTEKKTGQASFRLIKEPDLPTKPIGPSRLLALAVVLLGGILIGAAVAVFRNHYKGVFESAWQLKQRFDVGVLGTISEVLTPAERKQLGYSRLMFGLGCLALVGVFSGLVVAESNNMLAHWGESLRVRLLG